VFKFNWEKWKPKQTYTKSSAFEISTIDYGLELGTVIQSVLEGKRIPGRKLRVDKPCES